MAAKHEILEAMEQVKSALIEAKSEFKDAKGWLGKIKALIHIAPEAVDQVEAVSQKLGIKGADKKQLAIDCLLAVVRLPWWAPEAAVRPILGLLIDSIVGALNKHLKDG